MGTKFGASDWKEYIPVPICEEHPEYNELYIKAWELAFLHIKDIPGMPQNPYMDEAFCDTQIWIWDSCFMTFFCKYAREVFPGIETLNNFYEVLYCGKHLPEIIPTDKEPDWTGAVPGEPYEIKIHIADNPPIFAWAEYENILMRGDKEYAKELLYERKVLQKHYEWMESLRERKLPPPGVMEPTFFIVEKYGYKWEGGRSGMDNTPRGRTGEHAESQRPNNPNMLWVDAICQQALTAKMISKMFALVDDAENERIWYDKFSEKKSIVNNFYWDKEDSFYYDIDCNTHEFYKVMSIASYWTLTAGIASEEQAKALIKQIENPKTFGGVVPLVSLSRSDNDYNPLGAYWRGAVWAPTAYATLIGMKNYGFLNEAHSASCKLLEHIYKTYVEFEPHTLWECYSPEEYKPSENECANGKYVRPDFCGWSALFPISIYIEFVLGFHTIDAFQNLVEWAKPDTLKGKIGIKNLRFGKILTDIEAVGNNFKVVSNDAYTLKINGKPYSVVAGENQFTI